MNTPISLIFNRRCLIMVAALGVTTPSWAATINAASCSQTDVRNSLNSASTGDTITVPAGNCSWSSLSVNKAITLQGAGVGKTNISLTNASSLTMTKQAAGVIRLQNFSFSGSSTTRTIAIQGSWQETQPIIVQSNEFTLKGGSLFDIFVAGGVIFSKNSFTGTAVNEGSFTVKDNSPDSWSAADSMGSHDTNGTLNIYIEDNTFYGQSNGIIDADDNGRIVIRHNILSYGGFNSHGMDTSPYGLRHFEIYENTFLYPESQSHLANVNKLIWIRGGTGVMFNNVIPNITGSSWGDKSEGVFDIRAQQDGSGQNYGTYRDGRAWLSCGKGTYPRQHQLGVNWSPSVNTNGGYFIDPIYIWGNIGSGSNSSGGILGFENGGTWGSQTGYFVSGRDYFNGGAAKPGYTPYTYPHPLIGSGTPPPSPAILAAPTSLRVAP